MQKKSTQLKQLLLSDKLEFILEAHNGLSAKIVEEAGFDGIWGSGLSLSASLGVRDSNELTCTQVLNMLEFMSEATSIPILLDADTGYGDFNNVRRLVRKLEQRDIAGMCMEDKLFPKTNSLLVGAQQDLADIEEMAGKVKAAKDTQMDPDFCVVARVEAFIAGCDLDEALRRAEAYCDAGADAVLIHSTKDTAEEVFLFMENWQKSCPVVIVPTRYCHTPTDQFVQAGFSLAIWANHMLRSVITTMQQTAKRINEEQSVSFLDYQIAEVTEVFRLQNVKELEDAKLKYLPALARKENA